MTISYRFEPEERRVVVVVTGPVEDDDLLEWDQRLRDDPDFRPEYHQLIDLSAARGPDVTGAAIRELAARPPLFAPTSRRAVVVSSDLGYGLARMFELRRGDEAGEISVFRDLAEALAWLASG